MVIVEEEYTRAVMDESVQPRDVTDCAEDNVKLKELFDREVRTLQVSLGQKITMVLNLF